MSKYSHQPKMIMWVLASLIFDSMRPLKDKILTHEIDMTCQSSREMIITSWRFHLAIEKQIIIK